MALRRNALVELFWRIHPRVYRWSGGRIGGELVVTTANILDPIPPPLRDRMEVLELPGYTEEEKLRIAKDFLVPKQIAAHGLTDENLRFAEEALRRIVLEYTREAGVRNLEREIAHVCRGLAKRVAEGQQGLHFYKGKIGRFRDAYSSGAVDHEHQAGSLSRADGLRDLVHRSSP